MAGQSADDWITPQSAASSTSAPQSADDWITPSQQPSGQGVPQPKSTASDVGHGIGMGLVKGAGTVLGMPSDLWQMLDKGWQWSLTKGAEKMGMITPEQGEAMRQPAPGGMEDYQYGSEKITQHLMNLAQKMGLDTSEPTTRAGQAVENVTSFLPAATMGAGSAKELPGALARYGLLPGVTSEAAGEATQGTAAEPYARIAGAIGPEMVAQGVSRVARTVNPLKRTLSGVTDTQAADAQSLLDSSRTSGQAPITVPEALDKVTGRSTNIGDVARVVEQSPQGGNIMKEFYAQRPGQVAQAGQNAFDQIAPGTIPTSEIGPRVQAAADQTVKAANDARTQAVDPLYKAAATERVPAPDMEAFLTRIDKMIATDKTGILSPELSDLRDRLTETPANPGTPSQRVPNTTPTGATIYSTMPAVPPTPRVPITDIENLDTARKYFRDRLDQPQWAQDATTKAAQSRMTSLLGDLRQKMVSSSPNFAAGKNLYQDITENQFNPLVRSPTGDLANPKVQDWSPQADIIMANNPDPRSNLAVGKAVRDVAAKDPDAAQELVRAKLEKTFNEATQANMGDMGAPNQFGAPKFAAQVMGNPQQAKNMESVLRALPNGDVRWAAFNRTMDIFKAMGGRQPVGSKTTFNQQMADWLKTNPNSLPSEFMEAGSVAASPGKWLSLAQDLYHNVTYGKNTTQLANIFTKGNVSDLRKIVGAPAQSGRAQAALVSMLVAAGADTNRTNGSVPP